MNIIEYIRENPRKILENLTSYLTILVGVLGFIIAYSTDLGLNAETLSFIVVFSAGLNRVLTYLRVTYLKDEINELQ